MRPFGHPDLSQLPQALDELSSPDRLKGKNKRFLFYWSKDRSYRHYGPDVASIERGGSKGTLRARFRCCQDYDLARELTVRFKVENVSRDERFAMLLNGKVVDDERLPVRCAPNGRDRRIHTVALGPYLCCERALKPEQLNNGTSTLEVSNRSRDGSAPPGG